MRADCTQFLQQTFSFYRPQTFSVWMPLAVSSSFLCVSGTNLSFLRHRPGCLTFCYCTDLTASCSMETASSWRGPSVTSVTTAAHSMCSQTKCVQGKWQSLMLACLCQSVISGSHASSAGSSNRESAFLHHFPEDWTYPISWKNKASDSPPSLPNPFQDSLSHRRS